MIRGEKVYLTALYEEDLEQLREWRNLPKFKKNFREYREITPSMQLEWYKTKVTNDPSTIMFAIREVSTNQLLGCCGLCYINWIHRNAEISLYIGWDESYIDDKGFALESSNLLIQYGFLELGMKKIWAEVYEFDILKTELFMSVGLQKDGILRKHYFYDGEWWDSYILSIINDKS